MEDLIIKSFRGLPKNKALIKYLSEDGIRVSTSKNRELLHAGKDKNMHKVDKELFFVIDEKNNSIELTDKGIEVMTGNLEDKDFFIIQMLDQKYQN